MQKTDSTGLFQNRNFVLLWIGQSISTFGDKFTEIGIPILIYQLTKSSAQLGLAFFMTVFSSLVLGLIGGVVSDRWDQKKVMVWGDYFRCILVQFIPILLLVNIALDIKLAILYVLIFVHSSISYFFTPAKISLIPSLVPADKLVQANSIDQSSMKVMEFAGYAAAGAVIQLAGVQNAFYFDAASFLISVILLLWIQTAPKPQPSQQKASSLLSQVTDGLHIIQNSPILIRTIAISFIAPIALGTINSLLLVFVERSMNCGASTYSAAQATIGIGLALGVAIIGKFLHNVPREKLLTQGVCALGGFFLIAFSAPYLFPVLSISAPLAKTAIVLPFIFLAGVGNSAIFLALRLIVQENAPKEAIGRIFSVVSVASGIAMSIGASTAFMADIFDVQLILLSWSVFLLVVGLVAAKMPVYRARVQTQPE
jgi:MFS family permease